MSEQIRTKFAEDEHISRRIDLPSEYGRDRIVAMVRDPWWIYTYWEITPAREESVRSEIMKQGQSPDKSVLRVYDVTGHRSPVTDNHYDIPLTNMAKNWYICVGAPGSKFCVEIGIVTKSGKFYMLARSNVITTPRFGISDKLDEKWMLTEEKYLRLFSASCGIDVIGKSSFEIRELFKKQLSEWVSSGGISISSFSNFMRR